jgi:hypothetical protein
VLPADTIISNTKIIFSEMLSEKRSKPPKATSKKAKIEDEKTCQYSAKPL